MFSFCEEKQQVSRNNYFLVSYDASSLFTSIPLQKTTEIAVELIFENNPELKIMKHVLKQHSDFARSGTISFPMVAFIMKLMGHQCNLP